MGKHHERLNKYIDVLIPSILYLAYKIGVKSAFTEGVLFKANDLSKIYGEFFSMILFDVVILLFFIIQGINPYMRVAINQVFAVIMVSILSGIITFLVYFSMGLITIFACENLCMRIIITCILAPTCEEFIYRFITINKCKEIFTEQISVIISAGLFSLAHTGVMQMLLGFIVGCLLGYSFCKTKNLLVPTLMHILINITIDVLHICFSIRRML